MTIDVQQIRKIEEIREKVTAYLWYNGSTTFVYVRFKQKSVEKMKVILKREKRVERT